MQANKDGEKQNCSNHTAEVCLKKKDETLMVRIDQKDKHKRGE